MAPDTVYVVQKGTAVKVARKGETPQDHTTQEEQRFTADELVASPEKPGDNKAAAQWAQRGYTVFQRGEWFLIVRGYDALIEF